MTSDEKTLLRMRNNPRDWRIEELQTVAAKFGVEVRNPRGSHVVFSHPLVMDMVCIPAHKPVKPIYVRKLLEMLQRIEEANHD
ncbi:MAG: type II toxin-antitoxin system HicA family toxin [Magnetococcales bacterium]|nr:type II toxin-antitoxin system HicA family toxin [Magnetococcales bacterium]